MECPISQRMLRRIFHVHGSIPIQELEILLFLVTQVSVISIFVTQFSIWYHNGFSFFFFKWKGRHWKRKHNLSLFSVDSLASSKGKSAKKRLVLITFSIYDGKLSFTIASNLPNLTHSHPKKRKKKKKKQKSMNHSFSIIFVRTSVQYITAVIIVCSRYLYRVS